MAIVVLRKSAVVLLAVVWALMPLLARADSKPDFKPGLNFYSPQQDAQLGKESSTQIDRQLPLVRDPEALQYLNSLGKKLIAFAPDNRAEYVWQFRIVNSAEINAFALPGGYIYVNRGVLEAAENEAQLAGVIAHESGHVVMRHGTHIATEAVLAQGGLAILESILGQSDNLSGQLAQWGVSLGVNSMMLKNSRAAETQADEVGTYILYQAGYDPHAMAQFFQIIEKKYPQRTVQFFSDHPNPENRILEVNAEIAQLGPPRVGRIDSPAFEAAKQELAALTLPAIKGTPTVEARKQPPPQPSDNLILFDGQSFTLSYPDNWRVERGEDGVSLYPPGGMVSGAEGETAQAYGAEVSLFAPQEQSWGLIDATQELLDSMRQSNPQMHVVQQTGLSLRGNPAVSTLLQSDSPIVGEKETDHLVTVRHGDSVLAFVFVAPARSFDAYAPTFDKMLQSIDLAH